MVHTYALNRSFYDVILKSFNPINDIIDTFYINYDSGKKFISGENDFSCSGTSLV